MIECIDDLFSVYKQNSSGTYDELIIDGIEQKCILNEDIKGTQLLNYRSGVKGYEVTPDIFLCFAGIALNGMDCDFCENDLNCREPENDGEDEDECGRRMTVGTLLPSELIKRGINGEANEQEMQILCDRENYRIEPARYWDLAAVEKMVDKLAKCKINVSSFCNWCVLMMRCCFAQAKNYKHKKKLILYNIGDNFDGIAFMDRTMPKEEIRRECRSILAMMRYDDHCFRYADKNEIPPFSFTEDLYIYVNWCAYGKVGEIRRLCVADHKRKTVNYLYAYNMDFSNEIAYNFLSNNEFDDLFNRYYDFKLDPTLGADYARTNR